MSQNFEEGSTHTCEAFQEFVFDLVEYSVTKYGYKWNRPADSKRIFKKIFKESFSDAIILFRNRHKDEFKEREDTYFESDSDSDNEHGDSISSYSEAFCKRTFQGKVPLMEIIVYFAYLLDTSLSYLRVEEPIGVTIAANLAFEVFEKYIEPFFTTVGGWHALYQVAEQYVDYVKFTPSSIVSESASEVEPASKL